MIDPISYSKHLAIVEEARKCLSNISDDVKKKIVEECKKSTLTDSFFSVINFRECAARRIIEECKK